MKRDGIPDLKVKFGKSAVQDLLKVGEYESIVIPGQLIDGTRFGGEDKGYQGGGVIHSVE